MVNSISILLKNIANIPLYFIARMVPKDPRLWIFGSWFGYRYSDNPRFVYEYVNSHEPDIRAVWLSRDREIVVRLSTVGYEAYGIRTLKGFWLSCRASAVFLSCGQTDVNLVGGGGALKVQLWHGIPLKKIKRDDDKSRYNRSGILFKVFRRVWFGIFPFESEQWDLLVTSGTEMTSRMASAFKGFMSKRGQVIELGNPRADCILAPPDPNVIKPFSKPSPLERIVCYAPTFRGASSTLNLFESLDKQELKNFLNKWRALLLIKLHYYDQERCKIDGFPPRVHFVSDKELDDINMLLPHLDVLITDYSSVFFDFLLLDRPMLFTPFDLDSYITDERGLYEPYREAAPGPVCMNWDEALLELDNIFQGNDAYHEQRKLQQQRFFTFVDRDNSRRVVHYVKERFSIIADKGDKE